MTTSPSETILNELYLFGLNLLDFTYGNDVSFVLRVAQTLQDFRLREEALQLYYACLAAARKLNDDWLTAQSLTGLHSLSIDKKKAAVENAMIKHYYQTQYAVAKIHMLQCLPDLKYVETCNCRLEAASLFEELLTLSHFY